jgi:hypothetical protein
VVQSSRLGAKVVSSEGLPGTHAVACFRIESCDVQIELWRVTCHPSPTNSVSTGL